MQNHQDCSCGFNVSRRSFLSAGLGGFLGFAAARQAGAFGWLLPQETRSAKAKSVIVLWLNGAPSQFETWDPHEGKETGGPTKAIDTAVSGVRICEHLPRVAKEMKEVTLVRSMTSKEASHERGRFLLHTGYPPMPVVAHPSFGSVASFEIGRKETDLPNYIAVGGAALGAGFLPPENEPFLVRNAGQLPENLANAGSVDEKRARRRRELLEKQDEEFEKERSSTATERKKKAYEAAERLMHSSLVKTFDLKDEKEDLKKSYGDSPFGRGCLLARRLVEAGVSCVEVSLNGWDTHQDNFNRTKELCGQLDPGMATLIRDLRERRMLENTLVVCIGEFGRTPRINGNQGRDHYARAWSMALAGGGVPGGRVIGATDANGTEVKERPVTVPDLFATLYTLIGVDPHKKVPTPSGIRFTLTSEGAEAVKELVG